MKPPVPALLVRPSGAARQIQTDPDTYISKLETPA
jgi:hypothetical protein